MLRVFAVEVLRRPETVKPKIWEEEKGGERGQALLPERPSGCCVQKALFPFRSGDEAQRLVRFAEGRIQPQCFEVFGPGPCQVALLQRIGAQIGVVSGDFLAWESSRRAIRSSAAARGRSPRV